MNFGHSTDRVVTEYSKILNKLIVNGVAVGRDSITVRIHCLPPPEILAWNKKSCVKNDENEKLYFTIEDDVFARSKVDTYTSSRHCA